MPSKNLPALAEPLVITKTKIIGIAAPNLAFQAMQARRRSRAVRSLRFHRRWSVKISSSTDMAPFHVLPRSIQLWEALSGWLRSLNPGSSLSSLVHREKLGGRLRNEGDSNYYTGPKPFCDSKYGEHVSDFWIGFRVG